jgi:hypothetical protein
MNTNIVKPKYSKIFLCAKALRNAVLKNIELA